MTAGSAPLCLSAAGSAPITSASPPALAHGGISAATIAIFTFSPMIFLAFSPRTTWARVQREVRRKSNDCKERLRTTTTTTAKKSACLGDLRRGPRVGHRERLAQGFGRVLRRHRVDIEARAD